ncbi:hypothetical protein [Comamonas thiooxydans]|nr:hypothetical protein [Comamonas thiooxydans]
MLQGITIFQRQYVTFLGNGCELEGLLGDPRITSLLFHLTGILGQGLDPS